MAEYTGWKPALTAALSKVGETIAVEQITLTAPLAYTLPVGTPANTVHRVTFTQDGVGGHTVTHDDDPVSVDLTAGASTTVEVWPDETVTYPRLTMAPHPTGLPSVDTAAIQGALDSSAAARNGCVVQLRSGTYVVSGLTIDSNVTLRGEGRSTVIQLAAGANADVIRSARFDALTGTNPSDNAPRGFTIEDLVVHGNKAAQTGASFGLRLCAYDYDLRNVVVRNCLSTGIYSEFGKAGIITPHSMEARVSNIKIHDNDDGGLHWLGPHDSLLHNVICWYNGPEAGAGGYGIWIDRNQNAGSAGLLLSHCHVYGPHVDGFILNDTTIANDCQSEGATGTQVKMLVGGASWRGGTIYYPDGNPNAAVGVQIGSEGASVGHVVIETVVLNCNGGALNLVRSGGGNSITMRGYQASGYPIIGVLNPADAISVYAPSGTAMNLPDGALVSGYSVSVLGAAGRFEPWVIGDTFNRADSGATLGSPDHGGTYYYPMSPMGIISKSAYTPNGAGLAIIDSGISDGYFEMLVENYDTQASLVVRSDGGGGSYYRLRMDGSGLQLFQFSASVGTQVGDAAYGTAGSKKRIGLLCQGPQVTVYVDGRPVGNPVVSPFQQAATVIGFRTQTPACRVRNLIARRLVNGA